MFFFFFSSRRRHTSSDRDWSSDVCSSDLSLRPSVRMSTWVRSRTWKNAGFLSRRRSRSEARRVGKECRSRWSPYHQKKNKIAIMLSGEARTDVCSRTKRKSVVFGQTLSHCVFFFVNQTTAYEF